VINVSRLLIFLTLFPGSVFALYNGNPSSPMMPEVGLWISQEDWLGFKLGYEFDDVYDRRLQVEGKHLQSCRKKVQEYESLSNFGAVTVNFNDRVEVFGLLGTMSSKITHRLFSDTKISYHADAQFAWGVGGRAILAYWGDLQFAVNAAYVKSDPGLSSLKVNGNPFPNRHAKIDFSQWQVGIGISYQFHWFIPYIGVDYSDYRARIEHLSALMSILSNQHITFKDFYSCGLAMGFGICLHRAFSANFEARFLNENAVSLSADFKF
jgi:hypothetical protein